ncbi:hypothetical protein KIW84_060127 [Lathyrus oleraceus]|uniref:Uncharacterized protein n=1 Tax=Pisum sativum TaxID=3888 RepID=A0A9D5A0J0_PEA|nr:hypothetical protein KIW84_060127 [Pisum sativum]
MCHGQLYQQRMKKAFDKKVKPRAFREGDLVLKKVLSFVPDSRGKWTPNYEGPYVVKRAFSGGALMLTTMDEEDFTRPVNSDAPSFRQKILDSSSTEASNTSRFKLIWLLGLFPKQRFGCWGCSLSRATVDFDSPKQRCVLKTQSVLQQVLLKIQCSPAAVFPGMDVFLVEDSAVDGLPPWCLATFSSGSLSQDFICLLVTSRTVIDIPIAVASRVVVTLPSAVASGFVCFLSTVAFLLEDSHLSAERLLWQYCLLNLLQSPYGRLIAPSSRDCIDFLVTFRSSVERILLQNLLM